jgi:predicted transcriptional regulator
MEIFAEINRINLLHNLIKSEKTGSPKTLAKRLNIGRTSLYRLLEELKSHNAVIHYSRRKESFIYLNDFSLKINYEIQIIDTEELMKINGGGYLFFFRSFFGTEEKYLCKRVS